MPKSVYSVWSSFAGNYGGRLIISGAVGLLFVSGSFFLNLPYKMLYDMGPVLNHKQTSKSALKVNRKIQEIPSNIFWPHPPLVARPTFRTTILNEVRIYTENSQCAMPPSEVITYYKYQMLAAGWNDVTEDFYNLRPEARNDGMGNGAIQDPEYLETYHDVITSKLVIVRGHWSVHIAVGTGDKRLGVASVNICAAETPSIKEFSIALSEGLVEKLNSGEARKAIDVAERRIDGRYHTTIVLESKKSEQAFRAALSNLEAQGWQPLMFVPQQTGSGYFAWLIRGKQYAALSVKSSLQNRGSSVTLTEVTPAGQKNEDTIHF